VLDREAGLGQPRFEPRGDLVVVLDQQNADGILLAPVSFLSR